MRRQTRTGLKRDGLGAREATGGETSLDVLSVDFDEAGALVAVQVNTQILTGCEGSAATVVARSPGGEEIARRTVAIESDYPFFGLVSIETPCVGRANVRLPGAGTQTEVTWEVLFGGEVYATGPAFRLGDLAEQPPAPPQDELPDNPVNAAVSGIVEPVLWGTASLGAAYLAFDNLDTISSALSDE